MVYKHFAIFIISGILLRQNARIVPEQQ